MKSATPSDFRTAVMYKFYNGYVSNFQLHTDDIAGIRAIYGAGTTPPTTRRTTPTTTTTTTTPPPRTTPPPPPSSGSFCSDGAIDVITRIQGHTYVFRGDEYALLNEVAIVRGYPKKISQRFRGIPDNIDAALYWPYQAGSPERTYFFKGELFWRWENGRIAQSNPPYPRRIRDGWTGIPDNLDAAFVWSGNGRTYFFKGDQYYRYTRGRGADRGYPRHLSDWIGLPVKIDAALQWYGQTYFFRGAGYYRYNDYRYRVGPRYPRDTKTWWFDC